MCIHTYKYIHVCVCMYVYIYIYICICICIYIYIYCLLGRPGAATSAAAALAPLAAVPCGLGCSYNDYIMTLNQIFIYDIANMFTTSNNTIMLQLKCYMPPFHCII